MSILNHYYSYVLLKLFDLFELSQVRRAHGIPEKLWEDKQEAIESEIEGLGDNYRSQLRSGWVKYLQNAYPQGSKKPDAVPKVASKKVIDSDD